MSKKETTVFPWNKAGRPASRAGAALGLCATFLLLGCHNFFVCQNKPACPSDGGGSGGGGSTADFAYISNSATGSTYIAGYDLTNGALTPIANFPYNLGFQPVALNISANNKFLYAASVPGANNPGIYLFNIASDGELTAGNNGNVVIGDAVSSMAISPDGGYLFALSTTGTSMNEYQINSSTGLLTLVLNIPVPLSTCFLAGTPPSQTCSVTVAPSGKFVVVALGTAGDAIFPYASTTGISSTNFTLISSGSTQSAPSGDFSVVLDNNNFAYIARTVALTVYSIDSVGAPAFVSTQPYSNSAVPRSVVLNSTQTVVFTANEGASTISSFGISITGALSPSAGSPFAGPTSVSALGVDSSGKYMIAAGYNATNGVQLFTITNGTLTTVSTAATGAALNYPVVLAMSH